MAGAQIMIDVVEGFLRERAHGVGADHDHLLAQDVFNAHAARAVRCAAAIRGRDVELAIGGFVRAKRKQRRVLVGGRRRCDGGVHWYLLSLGVC